MTKVPCEYCGKHFEERRGLSNHQVYCGKGRNNSVTTALKLAKAAAKEKRKEELRVQKKQRTLLKSQDAIADEDFTVNQDFPMEIEELPPPLLDAPLELPLGSKRKRRLPRRFVDHMPSTLNSTVLPTASLPHFLDFSPPEPEPEPEPESESESETQGTVRTPYVTIPNDHGLFRVYPDKPRDPDATLIP
ncbi:hypothetical protein ACEPAI_1665 [Sanghuangporus weigelae]